MADDKTARAVAKLHAALQAGDHYAALQLYRTLIKRCAGAADRAPRLAARTSRELATDPPPPATPRVTTATHASPNRPIARDPQED